MIRGGKRGSVLDRGTFYGVAFKVGLPCFDGGLADRTGQAARVMAGQGGRDLASPHGKA